MPIAQSSTERPQQYRFHQGDRVLPFAASEYDERIAGLREIMEVHGVDACVFTSMHSIAYYSGCLYCSYGRPYGLVVTATEWIPGLIGHDEGGRVVPLDDAPAFAAALAELAADPGLRARMGERNRRAAVERHGWHASARKLLDVYHGLLGRVSGFPNPAPGPTS